MGTRPLFCHVPCFLGYCPLAMTSAGPVGGTLYPLLLACCRIQGIWTAFDTTFYKYVPPVLAPISQLPGPMAVISGGGASPTALWACGLVLGAITFAVGTVLLWRRKKRAARANSAELGT